MPAASVNLVSMKRREKRHSTAYIDKQQLIGIENLLKSDRKKWFELIPQQSRNWLIDFVV